ncbi:MAG TPA: HD domain-containing phosphohydrolase [Thermoanaerobaculia bacterium]|nr:HD domain-containing phosphohydrolase [Thermoanaerobaculia bacterium]
MLAELKTIEPQLKQILYGCVEHVQATKAALYLSSSHDLNEKKYELVTSYQYNAADRKVVTSNDDLVDRLAMKRTPFFVNGLGTDQRFAEIMFRQGNDRILAAPLFSRGRLVGFIDMRDKAGKKPFDTPDVDAAKKIADQMLGVLAANKLFGIGPLQLAAEEPIARRTYSGSNIAVPSAAPAPANATPGHIFSADALKVIEAARQYLTKRQHVTSQTTGKRALSDADVDALRALLPAALAIPGAAVASLTAMGQLNNPQMVVALATVADDAMDMLLQHIQAWLTRANKPHMTVRSAIVYPFGVQVVGVTAAGISTILSAPLAAHSVDGLVLSVAFERVAEAQAQRALHVFLKQLEPSIDAALASSAGRGDRFSIAEQLLEPDFKKYPELVAHSREISLMAHRFARVLDLPPAQAETVRVAALVHDVGMRLLDYERLYRKANLSQEELRGIAEHPLVGAALVEPLLGPEVSHAVLRHHERYDGKGYPSRMSGQQIPLAARIISIVDAWVSMTSRESYQVPVSREEAIGRLKEGAGIQWDGALVERFLRALPELVS